jgi:hypothetical protein
MAATASADRLSCHAPRMALRATIERMIDPSVTSLTTIDNPAAMTRMRVIGLENCRPMIRSLATARGLK